MDKRDDEIFCLQCAKPIKKDFTICPYCRVEIKINEIKEPQTTKTVGLKPKKKTNIGAIVGIIFSIVIVITFLVLCNIDPTKSSAPTTESEQSKEVRAFVCSQTAIKSQLKSPATAKFPSVTNSSVVITKISTDKYRVTAFVDSENSFGALVRATYQVTITFTGEDTYSWADVNILE